MPERNTKSNPHELECIALDDPQRINDLDELDVGDRVLIDDRRRPLTVIEIGVHVVSDERIDEELRTPVVKLEGHWDGAKTIVLAHKLERLQVTDDGFQVTLSETDTIVDRGIGREKTVRRTHVVGAAGRAAGNSPEVTA
ncbi:hypothetical protein SAMN05192561_11248 [Halopenitus malekzadehii]|uniref:Uncharacterized protein n=1 Tax=Halopenitus malekzadehii TaxID=1267564 RepID=A0A1H6JF46_9EURY|nr:hypothetical protein [Halopenitus malekzadehii]SEH60880.1 hypothetical protein SAMN05192561_11248 [Halopenitus malekzadehii]